MTESTLLALATTVVWEGFARDAWKEKELMAIQNEYNKLTLQANFARVILDEALSMVRNINHLAETRRRQNYLPKWQDWPGSIYHNRANYVRSVYHYDFRPFVERDWEHLKTTTIPPELENGTPNINWRIAHIALPIFRHPRLLLLDTLAEEVGAVAALELYRKEFGTYPASLNDLRDRHISSLPTDPITSGSLNYERTPNGRYKLWSIGWNLTDEGGIVVLKENGKFPKLEEGDWVWQYPDSPEPIKQNAAAPER